MQVQQEVLFAGGYTPGPTITDTIDYNHCINRKCNVDFGDRVQQEHSVAGCSSQTRGIFGGGTGPWQI